MTNVVIRRLVTATALVVAGAAVAGCGVSLQSSAEPIPPDVLPAPVVVSPTPSSSPSASTATTPTPEATATEDDVAKLRLWLVQDDGLVAVESSLPVGTNPDYVMQALVVGPTSVQAAQGLRTIASDPLTGQPLAVIAGVAPAPTEATEFDPAGEAAIAVELSPAFSALPPTEQVLLLGQVVLSLTGAGESAVVFVDQSGARLAVPLPDGRLLDTPARASDYGPLIYRP
jgi:hypothetical protein